MPPHQGPHWSINIMCIVDFLPFFYLGRDISVWNSKTKQRVGDRLTKIGVVSKFGTALFSNKPFIDR